MWSDDFIQIYSSKLGQVSRIFNLILAQSIVGSVLSCNARKVESRLLLLRAHPERKHGFAFSFVYRKYMKVFHRASISYYPRI